MLSCILIIYICQQKDTIVKKKSQMKPIQQQQLDEVIIDFINRGARFEAYIDGIKNFEESFPQIFGREGVEVKEGSYKRCDTRCYEISIIIDLLDFIELN